MRSSRLMKSNLTSATCGTEDSRGLSGRREVAPVNPGHRPSASALGYALPARWAGWGRPLQAGRSPGASCRPCHGLITMGRRIPFVTSPISGNPTRLRGPIKFQNVSGVLGDN